ncbi:MAG: hypothetical protein DRJ02_03725 [Bacteroidetes bacterium]|nr:MAG: hypothetical protein DRI72_09080 [Bacteroidota bacterium]RLD88534.1 MAG: hypothetical protein DRJ02_03725 [Bacteroidota bacterium]
MKKIYTLFVFLIFVFSTAFGQIGGRYSYSFLEMPVSARVAGLGGNLAAIADNDINLGYNNPSLIHTGYDNSIALNYVDYFTDINYGSVHYANSFEKVGSFMATLQFMDYGKFTYADEAGNTSGTFGAQDYALTIGWGRKLSDRFSIGANLKLIYSYYESYNSFGLAVDVAGTYRSKTDWTMSLVASNIGTQLSTYIPGQRSPLPFNLQYVVTKRLKHVPFLFSLTYDHIEKWDMTYKDPLNPSGGTDPITGEPQYKTGAANFGDQLLRHFIVGAEIYLGKNIVLRGGYNYRRRQELKLNEKPGMVGFSWGFGIRVYKFRINYSRSTYHLVGSPNYISLIFDFSSFTKNNKVQ